MPSEGNVGHPTSKMVERGVTRPDKDDERKWKDGGPCAVRHDPSVKGTFPSLGKHLYKAEIPSREIPVFPCVSFR